MKTRTRIVVVGFLTIIVVVIAVLFVCPQIAATRKSYFDTTNGRLKVQWVSFGRVYLESIEETEYSKLLKNLGFEEQPAEWKPANTEELGIRRWFFPQHVSYTHGKIAADAYQFSQLVKLNQTAAPTAREQAARLRELIEEGSASEVKDYVALLRQKDASR